MTKWTREDGAVVDLDYGLPWDVWGARQVEHPTRGKLEWFGGRLHRKDADADVIRLSADAFNRAEFASFHVSAAPPRVYPSPAPVKETAG